MPIDVRAPVVVAVVVSHDGARWLPDLLTALDAQTRRPDLVVAADTGSTDGSAELLRTALGAGQVRTCDPRTGFGSAVAEALAAATLPHDWVWVLHDDCVPDPDALAALLRGASADPAIGVAGPKVLACSERPLLLEVGVTLSRSGRRETLLDRLEYDQGQHDGARDVLAVGSAGLLVRRDVWDRLGGFDPALPLLREDLDLGWRTTLAGHRVVCLTDAVLRHAEATTGGARPTGLARTRPELYRLERQHGAYVLLANLPLLLVPAAVLSLTSGALLRAVGFLIGKRPRHAAAELRALAGVLGRPVRLIRARAARRRTRVVPARAALPLLARRRSGYRAVGETLTAVAGPLGRLGHPRRPGGRGQVTHVSPEAGPTSEADEDLPSWSGGLARRALLRPAVGVLAGLLALSLLAARRLLGDGRLSGGALLPAPSSGLDLWHDYLASWHPVGMGSDTVAPPWLAVVAVLGSVLASAERAVTLLLLGAVPLAGLAAYVVTGRVVRSAVLRVWAAVTYALLPPVLAAVATGRLGTTVLAVLLPVAGLAVARSIGLGGADRRAGSDRAMWAAVLLLAVMAAFVPLTLAATAVLGVVAAAWVRGANLLRVGVLVVAPVLLLLPWLPALVAEPALLLRESGLPGPRLAEPDLGPVHPLLLHPGGPGLPPLLVTVGLVLAALAALLRPDRRRVVLTGWLLALVGLAGAVLLSRVTVSSPTLPAPVSAWPGPATMLAGAGLLLAAVVGASGATARVAASSFGWRQPAAGLVAVLAAAGPLVVAGWWLATGADGPLQRRDPGLLPAFVVAESTQPARPRTLVLRSRPDGTVGYALVRSEGPRLGDAELSPPGDGGTGLSDVVADLASGRGGDAAARLVPYAVRFVLAAQPVPRSLSRAVDAVPGVVRVSGQAGGVLWEVDYPTGRLRLLAADAPVSDPAGSPPSARVLPTGQVSAEAAVPAGRRERLLVLADPVHKGWHARLSGARLADSRPAGSRLARATYDGWAQAFRVPPDGGRLQLWHEAGPRPLMLWLQLVAVLAVMVLALPAIRTRDETEWEHR